MLRGEVGLLDQRGEGNLVDLEERLVEELSRSFWVSVVALGCERALGIVFSRVTR